MSIFIILAASFLFNVYIVWSMFPAMVELEKELKEVKKGM